MLFSSECIKSICFFTVKYNFIDVSIVMRLSERKELF